MGERKERRLRREELAAAERDRIEKEEAESDQAEAKEAEAQPVEQPAQDVPEPSAQEQVSEKERPERRESQRENAPRQASARPVPAKGKRGGKRRRRRSRIALQAAVVLLAFALVFGVVLGYAVGRSAGDKRAREAEARLAELTAASDAQRQAEAEAQSAQQLENDNAAALEALSGAEPGEDGDASMLMGMDDFGEEDAPEDGEDGGEDEVVVAEFDGGQLLGDEVIEAYSAELAQYVFDGYSEEEVAPTLMGEVLENMVTERVLEAHARELGVYELTAADEQQIAAEAQEKYAEQLRIQEDLVRTEGMSDAEAEEAARAALLENGGVSLETVEAELKAGWWMEKLYDALVADVTIGANDIMTAYNEALADQQERFPENPEEYEVTRLSGEVIVYNLPGYREVKMIDLPFDSLDAMAEVDDLTLSMANLDPEADAGQIAEIQARIDECYAPLEARAQKVLDALDAGESFDDLMAQYGGADAAGSCYIGADSALWTQAIIDAAMALRVPGDVSDAIRTEDGVYILQYVGDVQEGAVGMDDVYEAISAQTLETAQYLSYETQVNAWMEEANVKYYPERLQ